MPKRTPALLLAEALTFHGRYGAETEDQATHRRLQRNQMAATELLRLDALRLVLQTQLADYKEACTKAETRADQAEGRAKLMGCAWVKATDAVPQESDGEVFVRFSDGSIGTGWATYWHGSSNDFARWTFPDPDEFRMVSEWAKNVPASTGMHWTENEPVRLPHARTGRVYLAGPMTGISELNFPAFNQEAERLRAEGLQVLNPADHGIVDGADWADYLRHDIAGLASCERIHLLRGWTKSKGACLEMTIAKALGMAVTYQVDAEMEHSNAPAVPQGWRISKTRLDGREATIVNGPGGGCVACKDADIPRVVPESILYDLATTLLTATPAPAPAVPQGYEIHEIPADYSGLVWLEGQVRAVARRAQAATGPQGWTDADSDAARLALELECLLMDTKNLSVVSKWWDSANDALELHRQRLAAAPTPAPAQGEPFGHFRVEPFGWTDCAKDDEGAIALYERPQEVGLTASQFDLICQAIDKADTATMEGDYMLDSDDCIAVVRVMQALFDIAALRAKGGQVMRKHRKAKQRQMNNPIMQLMWAIDAVNASMAKRFQQEPTK